MKLLTFSTLFPNREMPRHGIFVAERLKQLLASGAATATVMAPVPWFPSGATRFGAYGAFARVPREEEFAGCPVFHPRYPVIPKVGMSIAPILLAMAAYRAIRGLPGSLGEFDLIDAHYFYPDGVAAALLGGWLCKPVIITGRGTDLNVIPDYALPRRQIRWAIRRAAALVTVSDALRHRLIELGADSAKTRVLRNGVDLEAFRPLDRESVRRELDVTRRTLLSVGNLVALKGHEIVIDAVAELPDTDLIIVGDGPLGKDLRARAEARGIADRVRFPGTLQRSDLVRYYNAADCLVLCSSREGMPNVVLESLACGTPVVATPVGGIPEVITEPAAGILMEDRDSSALVASLIRLFDDYPDAATTRHYAERFGWSATIDGLVDLLDRSIETSR